MSRSTRPLALIIGHDALGAALLGAAIETFGLQVAYPGPREGPHDAVRRLRPALVLVDADREDARHRGFIGPTVMRGAAVVLFGSPRTVEDVSALAAKLGIPACLLPDGVAQLATLVDSLALQAPPGS